MSISEKNNDFKRSIDKGLIIIKSILKSPNINKYNLNYFVLLEPKDVISGDFYWISEYENKTIIVVGDSTGHGISAAMISILGKYFLKKILTSKKKLKINEIMNLLRDQIILSLDDGSYCPVNTWGFDFAILLIDSNKKEVQYSGANIPFYCIRKSKNTSFSIQTDNKKSKTLRFGNYNLLHIFPDKMPIAKYPNMESFTLSTIKLEKGDTIYLFSDGVINQIGGHQGRKIMVKGFKKMLINLQKHKISEQKETLKSLLSKWMMGFDQVDDIIVLGVRI